MAKPQRRQTWLEVAVANGGFRKALKALLWAHSWAVVREALGHDPSVDEVAAWWREPRRTAFREQAAFRDCFPSLDTPALLFEDPDLRAATRKLAKLGDEQDAARKSKRPGDTSLLQLGMREATI